MKTVLIALLAAGIFAVTAQAEWTPAKPGDPRTCKFASADRPGYCGDIASRLAFQAKYLRVEGQPFVGSLRCPQTAPLTFMCAWKNALGAHTTVVRFAHKATGWKVAVGVIPTG